MYTDIARVTLGNFDNLTDEELNTVCVRHVSWTCRGYKAQGYKNQHFACDVESTEAALADLIKEMTENKCHDIKIDGRKI